MKFRTYLIPILSILAIVAFVWVFTKVVMYLLIASILTLVSQPLVKLYSKIKIKNFHLPDSIVSLFTILTLIGSVICIAMLFAPILINEIKFLSTLNFNTVFSDIITQFPRIKSLLSNFGTDQEITLAITKQVNNALNFINISTLLNDLFSTAGSVLGGTLAVLFITFFLIKENRMAFQAVLLVTPSNYEEEIKDILRTTKSLLSKYFVGLFIDVLIVSVLKITIKASKIPFLMSR